MRRLYTLLVALALPPVSLVVAWRGLRDRRYWRGWIERFGRGAPLAGAAPGLWVHAVSVGEVQAAASLVAALRTAWPQAPLAVTSATPTGRARAGAAFGAEVAARYAPYDLPWCLRGTLRRFRPALLVIMEAEIWPNLLNECARARVPVLIASARLSARSTARWRRVAALLRPALRSSVTVATQSAADARRFESLGVPASRIHVCGNIKFDRQVPGNVVEAGSTLRRRYAAGRPLWVAGSTHAGEEAAVLRAHAALRAARGNALLVLAPRHPARFEAVAALLAGSGLTWLRYSACTAAAAGILREAADVAVLLLDTIGELENFYAAADAAFVGGSLVPVGGHNLLEPAALGVATLAGPYQGNAPDVARLLADGGGLRTVRDDVELTGALIALLADDAERARMGSAAQAIVVANRGALARTMALASALVTEQCAASPRVPTVQAQ